ncbi:hypothetical protein ABZ901_21850 [Actinacidiphila alni]|uniref:hypothetical protein n=1 Tax=Actinacidiphila alni TaxID=380248 RepID=UPI0033D7B0F5
MSHSSPYGPPQPHEWQHRPAGHAAPGYGAGFGPGFGPAPAFRPGPVRPPDHDRHAYVAPLIATVLGGPLIAFCGMIVMISPMATDSCTTHGCHDLYRMLLVAPAVLFLAVLALGLSWLLPWRLRHRTARVVAATAAPLLAAATLLIYANLPAAS